jgi:hypothetical protein
VRAICVLYVTLVLQLLVRPCVHRCQHAAGHCEDTAADDEASGGWQHALQVSSSVRGLQRLLMLGPCCKGRFAIAAAAAAGSLLICRGLLDALVKIGRNEGVLAYWKGFAPYFLRLGNHTAFTFLFLEELKKLW